MEEPDRASLASGRDADQSGGAHRPSLARFLKTVLLLLAGALLTYGAQYYHPIGIDGQFKNGTIAKISTGLPRDGLALATIRAIGRDNDTAAADRGGDDEERPSAEPRDGFLVIGDDEEELRGGLDRCFSPLRHASRKGAWAAGAYWKERGAAAPITCNRTAIGSLRIDACPRNDACVLTSLDREDRGRRYFAKFGRPGVLRREAEIVRHLSSSERTRRLTASSHPRHPYVEWMSTGRDGGRSRVAAILMELLEFEEFAAEGPGEPTIDRMLSEDTVRCWGDVLAVVETLWDYRGGRYIHNDVHGKQILLVRRGLGNDEGAAVRCNVIDFGMTLSLRDEWKKPGRKSYKDPFWYTGLKTRGQKSAYIQEHGMKEFYERGWEFTQGQWAQTVFLKRLVRVVLGEGDPFPSRHGIRGRDGHTSGALVVATWCRASAIVRRLVGALKDQRKKMPTSAIDNISRMVLEQSTVIERGVSRLNCSGYQDVLNEALAEGSSQAEDSRSDQ